MSAPPGSEARGRRPEHGRPRVPVLHVVTGDRVLAGDGFEAQARDLLAAGDARLALHLRGPGVTGRRLHDLARALLPAARKAGALLLANDRVDVALTAGLDGAQLGERSLAPDEARALLPDSALLGASVHDVEGADLAAGAGVDFLLLGTIFATRSHPGRPGAGPGLVSGVARRVRVPVVAIGGVTPARVPTVRDAGALGVAVLGGVWRSRDPAEAVRRYLDAFEMDEEEPA